MGVREPQVLVAVGGGIAAFKAVELVREFTRRGAKVRVVMTEAATHFVGAVTFAGITGEAAITDLWDPTYAGEVHVELGNWADAIVVAPATANLIARASVGLADDAVLATLACARGRVFLAPAMHTRMWQQPTTVGHVSVLRERGAEFIGPIVGALASGETGEGRMSEPADIVEFVLSTLASNDAPGPLAGKRVLITAGGTHEPIDPVRFIGNRSSGKMGVALALAAKSAGARVAMVCGPMSEPVPAGLGEVVRVQTALEMHDAVLARAAASDVIVMAAAVADYRPAAPADHKLKRGASDLTLTLVPNPDILAALGVARGNLAQLLVGFALETGDPVPEARRKLAAKGADLIVANGAETLGAESTAATLVWKDRTVALGALSKDAAADAIIEAIARTLVTNAAAGPQ